MKQKKITPFKECSLHVHFLQQNSHSYCTTYTCDWLCINSILFFILIPPQNAIYGTQKIENASNDPCCRNSAWYHSRSNDSPSTWLRVSVLPSPVSSVLAVVLHGRPNNQWNLDDIRARFTNMWVR